MGDTTSTPSDDGANNSSLGLPSDLSNFLTKSDFRLNWEFRNKFIIWTITATGALFVLIVLIVLGFINAGKQLTKSDYDFIHSIMWMILSVFMALIGSTFFGKHFDVKSYRDSVVQMVKK